MDVVVEVVFAQLDSALLHLSLARFILTFFSANNSKHELLVSACSSVDKPAAMRKTLTHDPHMIYSDGCRMLLRACRTSKAAEPRTDSTVPVVVFPFVNVICF